MKEGADGHTGRTWLTGCFPEPPGLQSGPCPPSRHWPGVGSEPAQRESDVNTAAALPVVVFLSMTWCLKLYWYHLNWAWNDNIAGTCCMPACVCVCVWEREICQHSRMKPYKCACVRAWGPTLSLRSSLCRAAPLLLLSLMDGERSRFLMRLRIVPPPSAVIALLAGRLAAFVNGWSLSSLLYSPPQTLLQLSCCLRVEPTRTGGFS